MSRRRRSRRNPRTSTKTMLGLGIAALAAATGIVSWPVALVAGGAYALYSGGRVVRRARRLKARR